MTLPDGFDKLYYRNLLYTAVTRAKKLMILIGTEERVHRMVDNNKRTRRYTCLREMLSGGKNTPPEQLPFENKPEDLSDSAEARAILGLE